MFSEHTQTKNAPTATSSPAAEEPQSYVFYYKDGQAVSWEDVTDAWAAEAGFQKRYTLTDAERLEIAQVLTAEAGGEPFAGKIAEYFETVPHKTTKTKHSYRLLSGTLVKKIGGRTMKQDDDALLAYLKASDNEDMIQTTEKPKWGEFKKRLEIVGGQIVDKTTGELVEGVQIIEKPDTFTVDV